MISILCIGIQQVFLRLGLKDCARCICASLFFQSKKSTCQTRKIFFISLQKFFSFWRKSNFRILPFQISWRDQMRKDKTRNTFHWRNSEVNTVCQWNLASLCHNTIKKKFIKNFYKNCSLITSSRPFCVCKELNIAAISKGNFWSNLLILDM